MNDQQSMNIPVVRYVKRDQRKHPQAAGVVGQIEKVKSPDDKPETISAKSEIRPLRKAPLVRISGKGA